MNKIAIVFSVLASNLLFSQVITNPRVTASATSNGFIDASQNTNLSNQSRGRALIFPSTDLSQYKLNTTVDALSMPTAYDGMIVYNTKNGGATTDPNITATTDLTPGFYYFSNPTGRSKTGLQRFASGKWVRIGDGSNNRVVAFTDGQEVETNTTIDGAKVYAIKGSFVHDGGNSVLINKPTDFANLSQIKVYRKNGTGTDKNLVGSSLYSYEVVGNQIKLIFGQGGILSLSYPQGNYEYMLEYTK